ncbi:hypothetical protein FJQ87_00480 [Shewanella sp. SNU WT4]|uniref:hypothetical protein n=1 Tax=Shewanella sp. SNU WT4 TaxID=2590015 RepID=UPI0011274B6E|nr:hypothetical protein [Shewanella sp. SNU WT4]QDF65357.1 hypothetical protein FJQ87_00480 [Shewanella sp. SNU WT4]
MTYAIGFWLAACSLSAMLALDLGIDPLAMPQWVAVLVALLFMPRAGMACGALLLGMWVYISTLDQQSLEMSLSVWVMAPVIMQALDHQRVWQFRALLLTMACSLFLGLIVLQAEGRLAGDATVTLWQLFAITLLCLSGRYWQPTEIANPWLLLPLMVLLGLGQFQPLLLTLKLMALIYCLQRLKMLTVPDYLPAITQAMPIMAFVGLTATVAGKIPAPILLAWLLTLVFVWLGDRVYTQEQTEE